MATKSLLLSVIERARKGIQVEESNLELKSQWWNWRSELNEFLKDICSMANTHTGDSYIIIGLRENGALQDAPLPFDESKIQAKHKDKIEPKVTVKFEEFLVQDKKISVATIPHSSNRPHVIKKWRDRENWIPIRVGTSTLTASRTDLDEMYDEKDKRKVSKLLVTLFEEKIRWDNYAEYEGPSFLVRLKVDNYEGKAPDYITKVMLVEESGDHWQSKYFRFGGLSPNQEIKIEAEDIVHNLPVYLSDQPPSRPGRPRPRPDVDKDRLVLYIFRRSDKQPLTIPLKAGWIEP